MEKIKEYKGIIILILIVSYFVFDWYSFKPRKIREQCFAEGEFNQSNMSIINDKERASAIDDYYRACLHRFGLEK